MLTLDEVGEAVGEMPIGADGVSWLFTQLSASGMSVQEGPAHLPELLREVLRLARELKDKGVAPSPQNIASASDISERAVRVALLYADVLRG